jgi:hypothetical protein
MIAVVMLVIAAVPLTACAQKQAAAATTKPAVVEAIEGSEFKRVVVTEAAAKRLDIQTAPVRQEQVDGAQQLAVPYAAVLYGLHGETWVYVNTAPLAYVREPITVDRIDGNTAFLLAGPPVDTAVVTVGGAELYGTETGVSK